VQPGLEQQQLGHTPQLGQQVLLLQTQVQPQRDCVPILPTHVAGEPQLGGSRRPAISELQAQHGRSYGVQLGARQTARAAVHGAADPEARERGDASGAVDEELYVPRADRAELQSGHGELRELGQRLGEACALLRGVLTRAREQLAQARFAARVLDDRELDRTHA
jgi:hypothetical protein